jgi:hypothetical protein
VSVRAEPVAIFLCTLGACCAPGQEPSPIVWLPECSLNAVRRRLAAARSGPRATTGCGAVESGPPPPEEGGSKAQGRRQWHEEVCMTVRQGGPIAACPKIRRWILSQGGRYHQLLGCVITVVYSLPISGIFINQLTAACRLFECICVCECAHLAHATRSVPLRL